MIVGIDIGGSTTDAVVLENGGLRVVTIEANDPVAAAAGALGKMVGDLGTQLDKVTCVAATGAGSRALGDTLSDGRSSRSMNFTAIGVGGTSLAGQTPCTRRLARHRHRDRFGQQGDNSARQRHRRRRRHVARPREPYARGLRARYLEAMANRGELRGSTSAYGISPAGRSAICLRARPPRISAKSPPTRPPRKGAGDHEHDRRGDLRC